MLGGMWGRSGYKRGGLNVAGLHSLIGPPKVARSKIRKTFAHQRLSRVGEDNDDVEYCPIQVADIDAALAVRGPATAEAEMSLGCPASLLDLLKWT